MATRATKPIIDGLANSQQEKNSELSQCITQLNSDLDTIFNTINNGPLPAIDGSKLTGLTFTQLAGIIPRTKLPSQVAYTDVANIFTLAQLVKGLGLAISLEDTSNPAVDTFYSAKTINREWRFGIPAA